MYYGLSIFAIVGSLFAGITSFFAGTMVHSSMIRPNLSIDNDGSKLYYGIRYAKYPVAYLSVLFVAVNIWFQLTLGYAIEISPLVIYTKIFLISLLILLIVGISATAGSYTMLTIRAQR